MSNQQVPPGWYPDPQLPGSVRWWDGTRWTEATQQAQPAAPPGPRWWQAADGGWHPPPAHPGQGAGPLRAAGVTGGAQRYQLRITKVTSFVVICYRQTVAYTGTFDELAASYKKVLRHNVLFGWWSIFGLVWTPMKLSANATAFRQLRQIAGRQ